MAKWGKAVGARRFVLASSPGAKESSLSFYLRAKGQIERRVSELSFGSLQIVRPPIILGERSDARPLERLAAAVFKLLFARSVNLDHLAAQVVSAASVILASNPIKIHSFFLFILFDLLKT